MIRVLVAACGFLLVAAATLIVTQFPDDPAKRLTATARVEPDSIFLSGEVRLTLAVEGPGPLEVTPGRPLLTKANQWRVKEDALPLREKLAAGRERWVQVYRLSPLVVGDPKIALAPLGVRTPTGDTTLTWDGELGAQVKTKITNPAAEAVIPATDVEALPKVPDPPTAGRPWLFAVVPILLLVAAAILLLARRKRSALTPRDAAWALGELSTGEGSADRYATVLRQYLAFRFGLPTDVMTTPELASRLRATPGFPTEGVGEWESLFDDFDVARFSGTAAEVQGLADRAKGLVAGQQVAQPG